MKFWLNVIAHNYIFTFELDLSSNINHLTRTIDAKLEQAASVRLLIKVYMVVVWYMLSKWKEATIVCISYNICLNMTNKEKWVINPYILIV